MTDPSNSLELEEDFVETDRLNLFYRAEGNKADDPVLMIMGLNSQLIHWPQEIVDKIVAAGYRVIRFDNRDSGLTAFRGATPENYTLKNMADDAVDLLDALDIPKAHVVGASMGGMIAQRLAIDHPGRVQTLCSIMSTPHFLIGPAEEGVLQELIKPLPPERDDAIKRIVELYELIGSDTYAEEEHAYRETLAAAAYDRGIDDEGNQLHPGGGTRQVTAIALAFDRTPGLKKLTVPALVIHGNEDPLVTIPGGRATRDAIPDAQWLACPDDNGDDGVDGMGHDLPAPLHETIVTAIVANIKQPAMV